MTGSSASQRAAIAASFVVQAAVIALAVAALNFGHPGQPAFAAPSSVNASPVIFPMRVPIPVTVDIAGDSHTVQFPVTGQAPAAEVGGNGNWTVNVTVYNLAPRMSNVWFAISGPRPSDHASVVSEVSDLSPGRDQLMFIVPAADVPAGGEATIIMGATENGHEVKSAILDIVTKGAPPAN